MIDFPINVTGIQQKDSNFLALDENPENTTGDAFSCVYRKK